MYSSHLNKELEKYFISKVIEKKREKDNGILCSFLRESTKAEKTFAFP